MTFCVHLTYYLSYYKMFASSKKIMRSLQSSKQHMFSGKMRETKLAHVLQRPNVMFGIVDSNKKTI